MYILQRDQERYLTLVYLDNFMVVLGHVDDDTARAATFLARALLVASLGLCAHALRRPENPVIRLALHGLEKVEDSAPLERGANDSIPSVFLVSRRNEIVMLGVSGEQVPLLICLEKPVWRPENRTKGVLEDEMEVKSRILAAVLPEALERRSHV